MGTKKCTSCHYNGQTKKETDPFSALKIFEKEEKNIWSSNVGGNPF